MTADLAEALAAIRALPNPHESSGEWRRRDWERGGTDALDAAAAVLADVTEPETVSRERN